MNKKEQILDLYFNKHLKQIDISKKLDVSQQYISKVIKASSQYQDEKATRKSINAEKRKIAQAKYQKNYNRSSKKDLVYEQLLALQKQDAIELSYNAHPLSDCSFRKSNSSIYSYDSKKNQYRMLRGIKTSVDAPKRISCKSY